MYSMFLVVIGWTIFAQTDMTQLGRYLKAMFGIGVTAGVDSDFLYFISCNAVLLVVLVLCSIDHRGWIAKIKTHGKKGAAAAVNRQEGSIYDLGSESKAWTAAKAVLMAGLLVLSFAFLVGDSYNPFLYFRF